MLRVLSSPADACRPQQKTCLQSEGMDGFFVFIHTHLCSMRSPLKIFQKFSRKLCSLVVILLLTYSWWGKLRWKQPFGFLLGRSGVFSQTWLPTQSRVNILFYNSLLLSVFIWAWQTVQCSCLCVCTTSLRLDSRTAQRSVMTHFLLWTSTYNHKLMQHLFHLMSRLYLLSFANW